MSNFRTAYYLVSAFSSNPFGGNPAAVAFLDVASSSAKYLGKIAGNLNQPILSVLSKEPLPCDDEGVLVHSIRFLTASGIEVPLCGHGTLAASKVLLSSREVQAKGIHTVHFKTLEGATLKAVQVADGFIEIEIPAADIKSVSPREKARLKEYVDRAFGRDVLLNDIKIGSGNYAIYVMFELDVSEDLAGSTVDAKHLLGDGFVVNVLTTKSPKSDAVFVSRMFAPSVIGDSGEDHVCGSAHGLLVPHWLSKLGIASGDEVKAKQVSVRGGELRVIWNQEEQRIRLRGPSVILASGELYL